MEPDNLAEKLDKKSENNENLASPTMDYFANRNTPQGEIENDYDFGSAGSSSHRDSDEESWETVSEEMRAEEALQHVEDEQCFCNSCSAISMSLSSRIQSRSIYESETLPENVSEVVTESGASIYVVGTAHFSEASQEDVKKAIQYLSPDVVMVELCASRVGVLKYDEESLLKAAQDVSVSKLRMAIKESGSVISGVMQLLLLSMSAHITKQLGMAPGGEFRIAAKQARQIPGCRLVLGDRPIQSTLGRAMASLSIFQKMKLGWHLIFSNDTITKEDVEKYKQKDMIAEMLAEMTGDFPELSKVFVLERDQYMAQMLVHCIDMVKNDLPALIKLNNDDSSSANDTKNAQETCTVEKEKKLEEVIENKSEGTPKELIMQKEIEDKLETEVNENPTEIREREICRKDYHPVIVCVVGIGHMNGIIENIGKNFDINELNEVPPPSYMNKAFKMTLKAAVVGVISWSVYSIFNWVKS